MPIYSERVMDHFQNPRNVGEIPNADGIGEEGNAVCGDMMTFYIKVKDEKLEDVKYKTFGCGAAIAVSSMVSEMAKGMTIDEALKMTPDSVITELDGLPKVKHHCSNLGAQALHKAIENYQTKQQLGETCATENPAAKEEPGEHPKVCPFCEGAVSEDDASLCLTCGINVTYCPGCKQPVAAGAVTCPNCGVALEKAK
jgi:nitrogen fixation protein NifU and related proteins